MNTRMLLVALVVGCAGEVGSAGPDTGGDDHDSTRPPPPPGTVTCASREYTVGVDAFETEWGGNTAYFGVPINFKFDLRTTGRAGYYHVQIDGLDQAYYLTPT